MIWAILCLVLGIASAVISLVFHDHRSERGFGWAVVSLFLLSASMMLLSL